MLQRIRHALLIAAAALPVVAAADNARLEAQREAFQAAWPEALEGRWVDRRDERLLKSYVLWPDLRAAFYSARLEQTNRRELAAFMQAHETLPPIRRLRYRLIAADGRAARWGHFLKRYQRHYADAGIAALDCYALSAHLERGKTLDDDAVAELARGLWLVGHSQHDHCDRPFNALLSRQSIPDDWVRARFELAIERRNLGLAGYLAGMLNDPATDRALQRWRSSLNRPADTLRAAAAGKQAFSEAQLVQATRQLALRDAPLAATLFTAALSANAVSEADQAATWRHIAIAAAQDFEPQAAALLDNVAASVRDQRVLEWRARTAMRNDDWPGVLRAIADMDPAEQASERWRFWEARALQQTGQQAAGDALLTALAGERSYHGFMAADALGHAYRLGHASLEYDTATLERLAERYDVQRARELLAVGQPARARAEWQRITARLNDDEKRAAAILAHRWQWHSEAITLLGELQLWDDLDMRFPLAHAERIASASEAAGITGSWVYGIARSESLFATDVRSSAGAWGLMQLMPGTGKRVAQRHKLPWNGVETLKQADSNIELGTRYLAELASRFGQQALATAAYNAGPHRVERWLPQDGPLDAAVWIETIPYDETRGYVQRVLAADVVFRERLGQPARRLSEQLPPVMSNQSTVGRASRL